VDDFQPKSAHFSAFAFKEFRLKKRKTHFFFRLCNADFALLCQKNPFLEQSKFSLEIMRIKNPDFHADDGKLRRKK
jgi:hypothetical protein